jgi:hypothetical protein
LLVFNCWKKAGEDARRVLPLNKNAFWNWEIWPDQRRRLLSFFWGIKANPAGYELSKFKNTYYPALYPKEKL